MKVYVLIMKDTRSSGEVVKCFATLKKAKQHAELARALAFTYSIVESTLVGEE